MLFHLKKFVWRLFSNVHLHKQPVGRSNRYGPWESVARLEIDIQISSIQLIFYTHFNHVLHKIPIKLAEVCSCTIKGAWILQLGNGADMKTIHSTKCTVSNLCAAEPARQAPNKRRKRKVSGGSNVSSGGGGNNNSNSKKKSPANSFSLSSQVPVSITTSWLTYSWLWQAEEQWGYKVIWCVVNQTAGEDGLNVVWIQTGFRDKFTLPKLKPN